MNILRTRASFLFFTLLGVSAAFLGSDGAAGETDLFWHLRLGLDSLDSGELVSTIGYNWTRAGAPYAQNDWLAEVIFALFFRLGGFRALALLTSVLAGVTTLLTFRASSSFPPAQTALAETPSSIRATAIAAASALLLSVPTMTTRPWLFGYVCAASLVWLMRRADARQPGDAGKYPRLVSCVITYVIFVVWGNTHGSWTLGVLYLGMLPFSRLERLARRSPRWQAVQTSARGVLLDGVSLLAAAVLGVATSPLAPGIFTRPFALVGAHDLDLIAEWAPLPLTGVFGPAYLGVVVLTAALAVVAHKRISIVEALFVAFALASALLSRRFVGFGPLLAAPFWATLLAPWIPDDAHTDGKHVMNTVVAAVGVLFLGGRFVFGLPSTDEAIDAAVPEDGVEFLLSQPFAREHGFHTYQWGGMMVFRGLSTFMDGRFEPFAFEPGIATYIELRDGDVEGLERRGVRWVWVAPEEGIVPVLASRPGWHLARETERWVVYVRDVPPA